MKTWNGTMKSESFNANVSVYFIENSETILGDWYGNGVAESLIHDAGEYETNIGKIIITKLESDGITFTFGGSGNPNLV
jgi:hypothetical protein